MIRNLTELFDRSPYPDVVVDSVCSLVTRSCTMIPFDNSRFPELLTTVSTSHGPNQYLDSSSNPAESNNQLLEAASEVERHVSKLLWSNVLNPCVRGLSSEVVVVPSRDTMFESAVYRDESLQWKIEVYLFTDESAVESISRIRDAKQAYICSLKDGTVPTGNSKQHKLAEIQMKGDLFGYPSCCTEQFLSERRTRFETLLTIGDNRIQDIRQKTDSADAMRSAFREAIKKEGVEMRDLNPESRIIGQLSDFNLGRHFEDWSYEQLLSFFKTKCRSGHPSFFYSFFSEQFYPHHPQCEEAITIGRKTEATLAETYPGLVSVYRCAVILNLFSYLGFGERLQRRRLLQDISDVGS